MENFVDTQLRPVGTCMICTEPFSATHEPVALPCKHIFGHECIKRWVKDGRGNTRACPTCRHVLVEKKNSHVGFDAPSMWKALCEQPPERLSAFMASLWPLLQHLWQRKPSGKFSVTDMLEQIIIPALISTARRTEETPTGIMMDCYNLIAASWDSLGRPDHASGLAIPLIRLARLMACASTTLPKCLTINSRVNRLIWRANACIGLTEQEVSWDFIMEASELDNDRYIPLLHLYTILISQSIAYNSEPNEWPKRRHEIMNHTVERCCTKIGGIFWIGKPSNQFKDVLLKAYEELRRHQLEKKKLNLRGRDGEESIVKGIWALAGWQ
ncbi:hypothetical protein BKA66DRAFT_405355 [Pyrenochaeta sp. MPI-SDFR-AT-0127]|nr:hypothetical protein BKA66DRAFT_405355 [Pyrenochaeta sp. MPI-SDFR-AT-0127]